MEKTVTVEGIEVTQAIQSVDNNVTLIRGKHTYIRVYLSVPDYADVVRIEGRLSLFVREDGHEEVEHSLCSMSAMTRVSKFDLLEQRLDWSRSLNFELPCHYLGQQRDKKVTARTELSEVKLVCRDGKSENGKICDGRQKKEVVFQAEVTMHCRVVAYRYVDPETHEVYEPTKGEIAVIRDYVEKAFPFQVMLELSHDRRTEVV